MNAGESNLACGEIASLLVFYVGDEVSDQERESIEKHLVECAACRAQLAEEREFQSAIYSLPQRGDQLDAAGIMLSQCRSELAEALDDLQLPAVKQRAPAFGWLRGWMVLHPAWSAGTLVLLGLVAGAEYSQWSSARSEAGSQDQVVNVRPSAQITADQLSKMAVAGINFAPSPYSGSKNVRVRLNAEQPIELDGNVDDSNVRNVLTFVMENGERFDSGVRLDCLDALQTRVEDSQVRAALLAAARKDQNPAVRLKALEALGDSENDTTLQQVLLDALQHDSNPGVRVEAVNLLVRALETQNQSVMPLPPNAPAAAPMIRAGARTNAAAANAEMEKLTRELEILQQSDPSRYVRLRSASALRELDAHSDQ
jgi:HEAT repeats/Putative zinc-finger